MTVMYITMSQFALLFLKEAPGNYIGAGWSGNVRAIKWRDQKHDGCKGLLCPLSLVSTFTRAPTFIASRGLLLHDNL